MNMRHHGPVRCLMSAMLLATPFVAANATTIDVRESEQHGPYLVNEAGESLYLFEADEQNTSECRDACAEAWPPVTAEGEVEAGEGVDREKLGTIEREDGSEQVTYEGRPLYRFVKDQEPGDTTGQDVEGFGAEWYLVTPEGDKVGGDEDQEASG